MMKKKRRCWLNFPSKKPRIRQTIVAPIGQIGVLKNVPPEMNATDDQKVNPLKQNLGHTNLKKDWCFHLVGGWSNPFWNI